MQKINKKVFQHFFFSFSLVVAHVNRYCKQRCKKEATQKVLLLSRKFSNKLLLGSNIFGTAGIALDFLVSLKFRRFPIFI